MPAATKESVMAAGTPDALLQLYAVEDFHPARHASALISSAEGDIDACLRQLAYSLNAAQISLSSVVSTKYNTLLSSAIRFADIESDILALRVSVDNIESSMHRIRRNVSTPFLQVRVATEELQRLQDAAILARAVARFQALVHKLDAIMANADQNAITDNVYQAATLFYSLDSLQTETDVTGVSLVDEQLPKLNTYRAKLLQTVQEMVNEGVTQRNQSKVTNAVEVLFNMGRLQRWLTDLSHTTDVALSRLLADALDINSAQRAAFEQQQSEGKESSSTSTDHTQQQRTVNAAMKIVTQRLDRMIKTWHNLFDKLHTVQQAMTRTREPISGSTYLELSLKDQQNMPVQLFWLRLANIISERMNPTALPPVLKSFFATVYPRIRRDVGNFLAHVALVQNTRATTITSSAPSSPITSFESAESTLLWNALTPLTEFYLFRGRARMMDAINTLFSTTNRQSPARNDVLNAVLALSGELDIVKFDIKLCKSVAANIAVAVRLFAQKAESLIENESSGFSVEGVSYSYASDHTNIDVINTCYLFYSRSLRTLDDYADETVDKILDELDVLHKLLSNTLRPLIHAIRQTLHGCILKIHNEDLTRAIQPARTTTTTQQNDIQCSAYMSELITNLRQANKDVFSRLHCGADTSSWIYDFCSRVCDDFLRNASLIRPLSEITKTRLANDTTQLQRTLKSFLADQKLNLTDLGSSAVALKRFGAVLAMDVSQLSSAQYVGDISTLVLLQMIFARQPISVPMPYQQVKQSQQPIRRMSVYEYIRWQSEVNTEAVVALYQNVCSTMQQDEVQRGQKMPEEIKVAIAMLRDREEWQED